MPNLNGLNDFAPFWKEFDYNWVFTKKWIKMRLKTWNWLKISRKEETLELIDWIYIWLNCPIHNIWRLFVMKAVPDLFIQPLFSNPPDSNYFWQKWPETSPWGRQKSVQSKRCSLNLIWWFWGQATLILALLHKKCNNLAADNLWRIFDWGTAFNPLHAITALICLLL